MNNEETELKRPSNIKQIGVIDDSFKVYIEDYAETFIKQYAKESGCEERIAVLLGRSCMIDNCMTVFISGVIKGNYTEEENGKCIFTEKSWEDIREQKAEYFPNTEITGWVYIQPGYGDGVSTYQQNYHLSIFREPSQVLLVCDPIEKTSVFYSRFSQGDEQPAFRQLGGYIIFYDKNDAMNRYMTENRAVKIDTDEAAQIQKNSDEKLRRAAMKALTEKKQPKKKKLIHLSQMSEQKKLINLFGTLSAILFVVCFVMGAGLVQNDGRISKLEQQLSSISESYKYIAARITDDNAQTVFADNAQAVENTQTVQVQTDTAEPQQETVQVQTEIQTEETTEMLKAAQGNYIPKKYTVLKGDSLDKISRKIYGDNSMVYAIMEENDIEDINCIQIGDVLTLPEEVTK